MKHSVTKACHYLIAFALLAGLSGCRKKDDVQPMQKPVAKVYVANNESGTVSVIDANANAVFKTIHLADHSSSLMFMPHNVQAAPNGKYVWITAMTMNQDDAIFIVDPATGDVVKQINVGSGYGLAHVVFDDESRFAYVTAYNTNQVLVFDAQTFEFANFIELGSGNAPHGLRYSNGKLYVAKFSGKSLCVVDVEDNSVTNIELGGMAVQTAVTPDGRFVFASLQDKKQIARLDLQTNSLSFFDLPANAKGPVQLYPSPDSKLVYVCDQGEMTTNLCSNKLYAVNVETGLVERTIIVGDAPHGVVLSRDGKIAYVTNALDNTVSVVNTVDYSVVATVPVGVKPNGISYWDESGGMP